METNASRARNWPVKNPPNLVFLLSDLLFHSSHGCLLVPWKGGLFAVRAREQSVTGFPQFELLSTSAPHPHGHVALLAPTSPSSFAQTFWAPVKDHLWQDLRKITKQLSPQALWGMLKPSGDTQALCNPRYTVSAAFPGWQGNGENTMKCALGLHQG